MKQHCLSTGLRVLLWVIFGMFSISKIHAEGSVNLITIPGSRPHLNGAYNQQFKVYAKFGEYINVGSSNLGIGGQIKVYNPAGTLVRTFGDNDAQLGIGVIFDYGQEKAGPVGFPNGFTPGAVQVPANQVGIWTVVFSSQYSNTNFNSMDYNYPWTRDPDQTPSLGIVAWDVTLSKNQAANMGGQIVKGRVFTNELATFNRHANDAFSTSFYVLTREGLIYKLDLINIDPVNYWLASNNVGLLRGSDKSPLYKSVPQSAYVRTTNINAMASGTNYFYEPQMQDAGVVINNKIFFSPPASDMPASAAVSDVFRSNPHQTWLLRAPSSFNVNLTGFTVFGQNADGTMFCNPNVLQVASSGVFRFNSTHAGTAQLCLDLNNNGSFSDPTDRVLYGNVLEGANEVFWDGKDGGGNFLPVGKNLTIGYALKIRVGEVHIMLEDVENFGGFNITLVNPNGQTDLTSYYYDHSQVGGAVSGGGAPGNPLPTSMPFTYGNLFGDNKLFDHWKYYDLGNPLAGTLTVDVVEDCFAPPVVHPDHDADGVTDNLDLDDDNDGVPDAWEYCNPAGTFACLAPAIDPSGDADNDGVLNYLDANDVSFPGSCADLDANGICDNIPATLDSDGDAVPDHLDLDSDNDGLTDLFEAGHGQSDADHNGKIDGDSTAFGPNGLFDLIDSDPTSASASATYARIDSDADGVPDHDDLDSDNDGIHDVAEAAGSVASVDPNNDGQFGLSPAGIDQNGLTAGTNFNPLDSDGDNVLNFRDLDSDNDGIHDVVEADFSDADNDGRIGSGAPTVNADGQAPGTTSFPADKDNDLIFNYLDLDSDNDGINDVAEANFSDTDNDGRVGTGIPAVNAAGQASGTTSQPADKDSDSIANFFDLDSDNDGINDVAEALFDDPDNDGRVGAGAPTVNANGQANGATSTPSGKDNDLIPNYLDLDSDNDGINDLAEIGFDDPDNDGIFGIGHPTVNANGQAPATTSEPADLDKDLISNFLDLDSDNDGINDVAEALFDDPDNDGRVGNGLPTVNANGQPPGASSKPNDLDADARPNYLDRDSDGDGIFDVMEGGNADDDFDGLIGTGVPTVNADGQPAGANSNPTNTDGEPNSPDFLDLDSDNDLLADADECPAGTPCPNGDGDQLPDFQDVDRDNDGIVDNGECENNVPCVDTDGDGTPDVDDLDSDNDAITDANECSAGIPCPDTDGDGTPDFRDLECNPNLPGIPSIGGLTGGGSFCEGQSVTISLSNTNAAVSDSITLQITGPLGFVFFEKYGPHDPIFVALQNMTPANSGNYLIKLKSKIGCESAPQTVSIEIKPQPATPSVAAADPTPCAGSTAVLTTSAFTGPNVVYEWFFEKNGNSVSLGTTTDPNFQILNFSNTDAGNYSVKIDANGCVSGTSAAVGLSIAQPGVTLVATNSAPGGTVQVGNSVQFFLPTIAGASYAWTGPNGFTSNQQNPIISAVTHSDSGSYSAVVTIDGCPFASSATSILVTDVPPPPTTPDSDGDGVEDKIDLDDDNDGVPDSWEYCNPAGTFACLVPTGDPSADSDLDGVPNFLDANDLAFPQACPDQNSDGRCDKIISIFDTDGDGVADHLDLDSDNDGITDLRETGHGQADADGNGVLDGPAGVFGSNGLFDPIDSDPASASATATYVRIDHDADGVPDHDDLDSDNDGIHDVAEAGFEKNDANNDGNLDDGSGNPAVVGPTGLANFLDPAATSAPIPAPQDTDNDGVADWRDRDSDNDGINDAAEASFPDPDNDGQIGSGPATVTPDGRTAFSTSHPTDTDADDVPDWHDLDSDNDGINDVAEVTFPDQDNDGKVGTGTPNTNIFGQNLAAFTSAPLDHDLDGVRDWRDLDSDNDGINDVVEGGHADPDGNGQIGTGSPAVNANGQAAGANSLPTNTDGDMLADFRELDSDDDGIFDVMEGGAADPDFDGKVGTGTPVVNPQGQAPGAHSHPTDTDGDGKFDFQELDSDNDNLPDADECPSGTPCPNGDGDQLPDFQDVDRDNDGIVDNGECETSTPCTDTDGDGTADVDDLDSDNDGIPDANECSGGIPCPDKDGDGIPDFRDFDCTPAFPGIPALSAVTGGGSFCEGSDVTLSFSNTNVNVAGSLEVIVSGPGGFSQTEIVAPTGVITLVLEDLTPAQSGIFSIKLKSAQGCESVAQSVSIQITPTPALPVISTDDKTLCPGGTLNLETQQVAGANVSYEWFFNGGTQVVSLGTTSVPAFSIFDFSKNNEGQYAVQVTVNGCKSSISVPISVSEVNPGVGQIVASNNAGGNPVCEGFSVQLGLPGFPGASYAWVGPNGFTSNEQNPVINPVMPANAGSYQAVVTLDGCTFPTTSTSFSVNPKPVPATLSSPAAVCEGSDVSIEVTKPTYPTGALFQWFDGAGNLIAETQTPVFEISNAQTGQSGSYSVAVWVGGCSSDRSATTTVQVDGTFGEIATITNDVLFACNVNELNIKALQPQKATGVWTTTTAGAGISQPGNASTTAIGLDKPETILIWTLSNGVCKNFSSATMRIFRQSNITAADDIFTLEEGEVLEYGNITANDLTPLIQNFQIKIFEEPSSGTATVTNGLLRYEPDAGFSGTDRLTYQICSADCPNICGEATVTIRTDVVEELFLPNVMTPNGDGYNDALIIEPIGSYPENRICVFNRWGDLVFEKNGYANDWSGTFNDKDLPAGTYFYVFFKDKNDTESAVQQYLTIKR